MTGCGSGQQSQTATQEPAVNGTSASVGSIALRDVRIRAEIAGAALQPGESVDLFFVAANQSNDVNDRLMSITSDVGTVTLSPANPQVPAAGSLIVGKPEGSDAEALQTAADAQKATAKVKLTKPIANALTYNFVFKFERAGEGKVAVPVSAGETLRGKGRHRRKAKVTRNLSDPADTVAAWQRHGLSTAARNADT